ncbi:MAG: PTS mannitol transporter subunit IICBA [Clostridia bacterium]|nr:PTS mannitol transporter subunit IICBA [Clostridia bacterium]
MSNEAAAQQRLQRFGRFLSGMVMPNIGAFIAWGLITAIFIPTGWYPNENLATLVGPMITYLLPLLIGFTGGRMVAGPRGGVIGTIATMGVIVGSDIPMFIGAMIMGPFGGYVIKKVDALFHERIPSGFEMLVNNFSAGIVGMVLALVAFLGIGPLVLMLNGVLESGVQKIVDMGFLPLASLFIEPGKILFLNNAINHGVLGPIGIKESAELGKSIFFLLETNPGPGLGVLLAYSIFGKGMSKQSAPGAIIIHFLGGIHEIYFPYILMNPVLLLAVIAGGASGVLTFGFLGAGLVATPSPGSIFALLAMTPKGGFFAVISGVIVAATVSFLVASVILKGTKSEDEGALEASQEKIQLMKSASKGIVESLPNKDISTLDVSQVKHIAFACDAGMGSSVMGASTLLKRLKAAGLKVKVDNYAIENIPSSADVVITHENLTNRAKKTQAGAFHISIKDYFNDPALNQLVDRFESSIRVESLESAEVMPSAVLTLDAIHVGLSPVSKEEAIKRAGASLVESGYVEEAYIQGMLAREQVTTTYIGSFVAIPHGTNETKKYVKHTGLVINQYPEGVDFGGGNIAKLVIGIAAMGEEHMTILANIAESIGNESVLEKLIETSDPEVIYNQFSNIK